MYKESNGIRQNFPYRFLIFLTQDIEKDVLAVDLFVRNFLLSLYLQNRQSKRFEIQYESHQ